MLDFDLAELYKCSNGTKDINKSVKRNIDRFPDDFYFRLTKEEINKISLRFQNGTLNSKGNQRGQHYKYLPYAFTEQGVTILATVLHTEVASSMSIKIMRAFVKMRHYINNNLTEQKYVNNLVFEHDNKIKILESTFNKFSKEKEITEIYFNGKVYDTYSKVLDIFKEAKKELIIIDRYMDKTTLDMIKEIRCKVILITGKYSKLSKLSIDKYNKTYSNLNIITNDTFHDRYFIIDRSKIYHSGNSINHIGYRKSSLNILKDTNVKKTIIKDIKNIVNLDIV